MSENKRFAESLLEINGLKYFSFLGFCGYAFVLGIFDFFRIPESPGFSDIPFIILRSILSSINILSFKASAIALLFSILIFKSQDIAERKKIWRFATGKFTWLERHWILLLHIAIVKAFIFAYFIADKFPIVSFILCIILSIFLPFAFMELIRKSKDESAQLMHKLLLLISAAGIFSTPFVFYPIGRAFAKTELILPKAKQNGNETEFLKLLWKSGSSTYWLECSPGPRRVFQTMGRSADETYSREVSYQEFNRICSDK